MKTQKIEQLDLLDSKIKDLISKQSALSYEIYELMNEQSELLKEKCKENIGRCFKQLKNNEVVAYCKIIDISNSNKRFNEYQYPAIWFNYPYDNSINPFKEKVLFSGAWGEGNDHMTKLNNISYIEITNEDYTEKLNEINRLWLEKITKINKENKTLKKNYL